MKRVRTGSTSPAKIDPEKCVICKEVANDDVLECSWCECLVHGKCIKISASQSTVLSEIVSNVLFFCPSCMHKLPTALSCYDKTNEIQFAIDSKFSTMEQSFTTKFNSLSNQLKDLEAKCLANPVMETNAEEGVHNQSQGLSRSPLSDDSVVNIALSLTSEQKEKERRQFNVILHNLKESDASDSVTRKQDDIESCCSLFSTYLSVSASIKSAIRLGKRGSRPCRLLKLTLGSLDEKAKILKHKMKLKAEQNPEHVRKIYISPDLTPLEQRRNNALRKQLVEMNKIQNIYVIRKGQIVRKHGSNVAARTSMSPSVSEPSGDGSRTAS